MSITFGLQVYRSVEVLASRALRVAGRSLYLEQQDSYCWPQSEQ